MKLVPVTEQNADILFHWLQERTPLESISFRMPTLEEHINFVKSKPYKKWYIINEYGDNGVIYLTHNNEIGVFITKKSRCLGLATKAIQLLMVEDPKIKYLANINPNNYYLKMLFAKLGFKLLQETWELKFG